MRRTVTVCLIDYNKIDKLSSFHIVKLLTIDVNLARLSLVNMALQMTNIYQAKTNFSQLVNLVLSGEDVVIAKAGKPVAKLVPYIAEKKPRTLGKFKGEITIPDDFDEEDEEINKLFYGSDDP